MDNDQSSTPPGLREYLRAAEAGRFGWQRDYDDTVINIAPVPGAAKWSWLVGHYSSLLSDLIRACGGPGRALDMLYAQERAVAEVDLVAAVDLLGNDELRELRDAIEARLRVDVMRNRGDAP